MEPALLVRPATPTFAGWWVLQNAGFWAEAWPPPTPLLHWTGPEAGAPSSGDSKESLEKTYRAEAEHRPQDPQGGQPGQGNRNREKALQTGLEFPLAVWTQSWCLRVYINTARHPPLSAGQIGCIAKLVPLLSGPLKQIQANWKAAAPAATPGPTITRNLGRRKLGSNLHGREQLFLRVLTFSKKFPDNCLATPLYLTRIE